MPQTFTVSNHHEVLVPWARARRDADTAPEVISLDFHTDVLCCARRGIELPQKDIFSNADAVERAVCELHHDEHFDWALRAGIISKALIIALSPCSVPPEHPMLEVRRHKDLPPLDTMLNDPKSFREQAESVLDDTFLETLISDFSPRNYILDIDCDYLLCRKALYPKRSSLIRELAKNADMITISCENDWVKLLRMPGEKISGAALAAELQAMFE